MLNFRFYKSGDVVRDIGMIYFYKIILDSPLSKEFNIKLTRNYLEIPNSIDIELISEYILNMVLFKRIIADNENLTQVILRIDEYTKIDKIQSYPEDFLNKALLEKNISKSERDNILASWNNTYFSYLRNSGKYGSNSQSKKNAYNNFKKLVRNVFDLISNNKENLQQYEILDDDICCICHQFENTKYDITHKDEKKKRILSKYNYTFMGNENNPYNNYGKSNNGVCFVCEFFNLMFLTYIGNELPNIISYTENLEDMFYLNYKLMLNKRFYNDKTFYKEVVFQSSSKIKLYTIIRDSKKGIILEFSNILDSQKLMKQLKLLQIIESFEIENESIAKKTYLRKSILNYNLQICKSILISNINAKKIITISKNISLLNKFIREVGFLNMSENDIYKEIYKTGINLGEKISTDDNKAKKSIVFKLLQLLKSNDREELFLTMSHLLVVQGIKWPKGFTENIYKGNDEKISYYVGNFIEGFLSTSKYEKKEVDKYE